jgi:flagella basal body P-ring formation protein FlgA
MGDRMKQVLKALCIVVAMVATTKGTVARAATEIVVRENVVMTRSVVRLGDVADIKCDDHAFAERLAALPLMPAPSVESQRFLRNREIEDLLAAHGVNQQGMTISGAKQVSITSAKRTAATGNTTRGDAKSRINQHAAILAGHTVTPEPPTLDAETAATLKDGVHALIASHLATKSADAQKFTISCEVADRHLAMLAAAKSRPTCTGGAAPWTGRQRFEIVFTTSAGSAKFSVYAEVTPPAVPVVVAIRAISRGSVFTAADVEIQEMQIASRANDQRVAVDSIESIIGMEARQSIAAGSILYTEAVQSPILVKRGELITVSSHGNGFRVRTTARALHDCSKGELVQVESLQTKERYDARVVGPREAAIAPLTAGTSKTATSRTETARR